MRIVSLLPSATEIVAGLGLRKALVARSHECDYPPEVLSLPACTAKEIELTESTPGIQFRATAPSFRALSVFTVDWDLLRGLRPTHIVTQTLCHHCAVSRDDIESVLREELFELPSVISLEAQSLGNVFAEIRSLAEALGRQAEGIRYTGELEARVEATAAKAKAAARPSPVVACVEWLQPIMLGGNWMPELIRRAGGISAGGEDGVQSHWMAWHEFVRTDPDVIVIMPCGYRLSKIAKEMHWLTQHPEWRTLKAVRHDKVFLADGSFYFNRPGPRLVESLEVLAEIISPQVFGTRREGQSWLRYSTTQDA